MFYKNARLYGSDFQFHKGAFSVEDGRFAQVLPDTVPEEAVDLPGSSIFTTTATPGRIFPTATMRACAKWPGIWRKTA